MDTKIYLIIYSDALLTIPLKAALTSEEFQKMIEIRNAVKQHGASLMVIEDSGVGISTGPEALKECAKMAVVAAGASTGA